MQIKIDETCGIEGEVAEVGEVIEVDDPLAKQLISYGRAHKASAKEIADAKKKTPGGPSNPPPGGQE